MAVWMHTDNKLLKNLIWSFYSLFSCIFFFLVIRFVIARLAPAVVNNCVFHLRKMSVFLRINRWGQVPGLCSKIIHPNSKVAGDSANLLPLSSCTQKKLTAAKKETLSGLQPLRKCFIMIERGYTIPKSYAISTSDRKGRSPGPSRWIF